MIITRNSPSFINTLFAISMYTPIFETQLPELTYGLLNSMSIVRDPLILCAVIRKEIFVT